MFCDLIFWVLKAIYSLVGDWGLAIVVLTVLFRLVLWPLTIKQTRSMTAMQKVQPLMQQIQEKYADDKERMNQEIMKLYQEHKVNPMSGCLPVLIPLPLLMAFYTVLRPDTVDKTGKVTRAGGQLFQWLAAHPNVKGSFYGILPDIMTTPKAEMAHGFLTALPYLIALAIFCLGIILPTLLQPKQENNPQARQQKMMSYMMAVMFLFIGYGIPAGCLLYYDVSSVLMIGQQMLTQRALKAEAEKADNEIEVDARPKVKKGNKKAMNETTTSDVADNDSSAQE
jgi:YidC/Oxa1 family membrane protein insertase